MDDKNILLSYETLFEFLRLERSRTELQKLPDQFMEDVAKLMKREILELSSASQDGYKKNEISIKNSVKILAELFERRERKIVGMALDKSITKAAIIDFSKMLHSEIEFFHQIIAGFDNYKEKIDQMLVIPEKKEIDEAEKQRLEAEQHNQQQKMQQEAEKEQINPLVVMFLTPMPSFFGPELEKYGPFAENDITMLPAKIANLLAKEKRAVIVNMS